MKYQNKPTAYAIAIVLLVIVVALLVGCTATNSTTKQYVITDKYLSLDGAGNECIYVRVEEIPKTSVVMDGVKIEQLYDHQVSMYHIGDTITVNYK